jgi:Mg-chelatase subunit ChlD
LSTRLNHAVHVAAQLRDTHTKVGKALAGEAVGDVLALCFERDAFLPLLDAFIEVDILPTDANKVLTAARFLGISDDEVLGRLNRPIDQLRGLIQGGIDDAAARYRRLVDKIDDIDPELLKELVQRAFETNNLEAMAALLGIALGDAAGLVPESFASQAFGYKGIGGGTNLLKQWFNDRARLSPELRDKIKAIAKDALVDLGMQWAAQGGGDQQRGMIPQNEVRPFTASDDLDRLDLDSTVESLIASGKTLDQLSAEDLWVYTAASGRAVMGVLIDISGSMSGKELAVCSIAVVMLLARLASEEVAIALFESDTHVVKRFDEDRSLDDVADQLLELEATGGTRVDAALTWLAEEFERSQVADFRVLFLLSDFCFFEPAAELQVHCARLAANGVRFLGAAHGYVQASTSELMRDALGGEVVRLKSLDELPTLLRDALQRLGDRGA